MSKIKDASAYLSGPFFQESFTDYELEIMRVTIVEAQKQAIEATLEVAAEKALINVHYRLGIFIKAELDKQSILNLKNSEDLKV